MNDTMKIIGRVIGIVAALTVELTAVGIILLLCGALLKYVWKLFMAV